MKDDNINKSIPEIQVFQKEFHDIDQFLEYVQPFMQLQSTQLDAGPLHISLPMINCGDISMFRYSTSKAILERFSVPPGHIEFVFPRPLRAEPYFFCRNLVPSDVVGIVIAGREHTCYNPSGFDAVSVLIPENWFDEQNILLQKKWLKTQESNNIVFPLRQGRSILFRDTLFRLLSTRGMQQIAQYNGDESIFLREWVLEEMMSVLTEIVHIPLNGGKFLRKSRFEVLQAALKIVDGRLEDSLSTRALAEEVGTSPRTLQYAFRDYLHLSPVRYILYRKLHAARTDLKRMNNGSRSPVSDVANFYSLHNYGRFSMEYKDLFGEAPSKTF